MNKPFLVLTIGLLVLAPAASAGVTGVFTARNVTAIIPGGMSFSAPVANSHTQLTTAFPTATGPYVNYQVSSKITPSDIEFYNNVTTADSGSIVSLSASNQLKVTFTNDGSAPVVPVLNSTITPGGFGIYTANPTKNPTYSPVTHLIGDINQSPEYNPSINTFKGWSPLDSVQPIASATFTFTIASDGVVLDSFIGSLTLNPNPINPSAPIVAVSLTGLGALANFRQVTPPGSLDAVAYQWDTTPVALALGGPLAVGASRTLTYSTVVIATNSATPNDSSPCGGVCQLMEFTGFGDPIGKGTPGSAVTSGITGLTFSGYAFGLPTFDSSTGILSLPAATDNPLPSLPLTYTPALQVPEPSTWVLMLTGVGLVGYARRRRAPGRLRLRPA
ncbi:MAG: hypothetical protein JWO83_2716 [Caulobacteraceae bacterium]|nr:hypothetical protein [Caulobacteraceae bacterium]